jgi:hypothetical protein
MNLTTTMLATKKMTGEKNSQSSTTRSNSIISNEEKQQQIKTRKISDEQTRSHSLPMMQELNLLRKRIKRICHSWLEECRTTLGIQISSSTLWMIGLLLFQGIMHIDAYHLPDLPLQPPVIQTKPQIDDKNCSQSAKQSRLQASTKNKFIQSFNRQPFLRTDQFECLFVWFFFFSDYFQ